MKFMGCQRAIQSAGERAGWGDLGGLGDRERCVGFLARATRAALFSRIRFLASTHTYVAYAHARTLPITSSQRMSAQKQQAKAQSTKQNSNSSKAQAWNACALILERGRGWCPAIGGVYTQRPCPQYCT